MARVNMMPYIQHMICMYIVYMICINIQYACAYMCYKINTTYDICIQLYSCMCRGLEISLLHFDVCRLFTEARGTAPWTKKNFLKAEKAHEKTLQESSKKWWVPLSSLTIIIYIPPQTYIRFLTIQS